MRGVIVYDLTLEELLWRSVRIGLAFTSEPHCVVTTISTPADTPTLDAMKSALRPIRAQSRPICQLCEHILQQPTYRRSFITAPALKTPSLASIRRQPTRRHGAFPQAPTRAFASAARRPEQELEFETPEETKDNAVSMQQRVKETERAIQAIYASSKVESEEVILDILRSLELIARRSIAIRSGQTHSKKLNLRQSSAGAILSLDTDEAPVKPIAKQTLSKGGLPSPQYLSTLSSDLLRHDTVFISADVLSKYVDLQWLLGKARAIPEMFYLYANKPVPQLGTSPPKFSKPSPKGHKQAIPIPTAEKALSAAIAAKDLSLALKIIDTTYCAPAFRNYKLVTKVLPPGIVATLAPIALFMIAQEVSLYSGYIDPWTFKMYAFAGLFTYVSCTGTLGFVAMTTANDHHDRVVWRPGVPLTERWLREDERAALDRIACAWGFKELWKRGDEEGEEWEGLREWCLLRGMVLDKPDLMPGMNA
jgi:hypothetical protein